MGQHLTASKGVQAWPNRVGTWHVGPLLQIVHMEHGVCTLTKQACSTRSALHVQQCTASQTQQLCLQCEGFTAGFCSLMYLPTAFQVH